MQEARDALNSGRFRAALEAVIEAGRMSDQPRAKYCAEIAAAALMANTNSATTTRTHNPERPQRKQGE